MMEKDINKNYIVVLKEKFGKLYKEDIVIERPKELLSELNTIWVAPHTTVWDLQSCFIKQYPFSDEYLDYIYPSNYDDTFVNGVEYPIMRDLDDLQREWDEERNEVIETIRLCNITDGFAINQMFLGLRERKEYQKKEFVLQAARWINATGYFHSRELLKKDKSVLMYSQEIIGWNEFKYQINNDISVFLHTNFGYGSSSYFLLRIRYKGLEILPYSHLVKYYFAGVAEILRCTRNYTPCRQSWCEAFKFIADFVNSSIAYSKNFIETYIIEEVQQMIEGLEEISRDPLKYISLVRNRSCDPCLVKIRPMNNEEEIRLNIYPTEFAIVFKSEKIIGALDFLESLFPIAEKISCIQPYIDRLLRLNILLAPEIRDAIEEINGKKEEATIQQVRLEKKEKIISKKIELFEHEIEKFSNGDLLSFDETKYEETHPEYALLKKERSQVGKEINTLIWHISDYNSFIRFLEEARLKINMITHPLK